MEILEAYDLVGSLRGAARLAGCDHHTVRRVVEGRAAAQARGARAPAARLADAYREKLEEWVERSHGRIRADRAHAKLVAWGMPGLSAPRAARWPRPSGRTPRGGGGCCARGSSSRGCGCSGTTRSSTVPAGCRRADAVVGHDQQAFHGALAGPDRGRRRSTSTPGRPPRAEAPSDRAGRDSAASWVRGFADGSPRRMRSGVARRRSAGDHDAGVPARGAPTRRRPDAFRAEAGSFDQPGDHRSWSSTSRPRRARRGPRRASGGPARSPTDVGQHVDRRSACVDCRPPGRCRGSGRRATGAPRSGRCGPVAPSALPPPPLPPRRVVRRARRGLEPALDREASGAGGAAPRAPSGRGRGTGRWFEGVAATVSKTRPFSRTEWPPAPSGSQNRSTDAAPAAGAASVVYPTSRRRGTRQRFVVDSRFRFRALFDRVEHLSFHREVDGFQQGEGER